MITCHHLELGLAAIVDTTVAARPTPNRGGAETHMCYIQILHTKSGGGVGTSFQELKITMHRNY